MPPFSWTLLGIFLSYILGILLASSFDLPTNLIFLSSFLLLILSGVSLRGRLFYIFLLVMSLWLGFLNFSLGELKSEILLRNFGSREVEVKGKINSIPKRKSEKVEFLLQLEELNGLELKSQFVVLTQVLSGFQLEPGDLIALRGRFRKGGREVVLSASQLSKLSSKFSYKRYLYQLKKFSRKAIFRFYPQPYASFLQATILGEVDRELKPLRLQFQKAGIAHILAISGLHIGLILFFFHFLLKALRIYGRTRELLILIIIFSYILISGARIPLVRAGLMAGLYIYFWFFYIRPNPFNILLASALLILFFSPQALYERSFLLSFSAISGIFILLYLFPVSENHTLRGRLSNYLKVVVGAWLFVAPLSWHYWRGVSLAGLLVNFLLLPLFSFALASALASILSSFVFPALAGFFALASYPFLYLIFKSSYLISQVPYAYLYLPRISVMEVVLLYLLISIALFVPRRKWDRGRQSVCN